jgi:hypothetical protein
MLHPYTEIGVSSMLFNIVRMNFIGVVYIKNAGLETKQNTREPKARGYFGVLTHATLSLLFQTVLCTMLFL